MRGFSIVELVVATGIAGVLGAVAWAYMSNSARKARVSEAKTMLSTLYEAEQTFRSEYDSFTTNFGALGLQFQGRIRHNIGFTSDWAPPPGAPSAPSPCFQACPTTTYCVGYAQWICDASAIANLDGGNFEDCDDATFKAGTHAHLAPGNPSNVDPVSLFIDHNKKLTECGTADPCTPPP